MITTSDSLGKYSKYFHASVSMGESVGHVPHTPLEITVEQRENGTTRLLASVGPVEVLNALLPKNGCLLLSSLFQAADAYTPKEVDE